MKSKLLALALAASTLLDSGVQVAGNATIPTQTFFVPLPEKDLFDRTFKVINSNDAFGPVNSIISISISTSNTIVWYDHQEDGYESNYMNATAFKSTTQVWGDGNIANGCAPNTPCTKASDDVLKAGQSIVLENQIDVSATANNGFKFTGGDKVLASYPIAITRGAYPNKPGSLMAGGVEVLETGEWGTYYVVPVGQNVVTTTSAFEHTAIYIMASVDGTVVSISDNTKYTLNSGQSVTHTVAKAGLTVTSTAPVQIDIITGDIGSTYQLRWFALFPRDAWATSYFSPVGDTTGNTKIYLYNPNSSPLTVSVEQASGFGSYTVTVPATSFAFSNVVKSGTGASLTASSQFIALSLTDTTGGGQIYDWGFPVLPTNKMTEKVLIGWGYGCTGKNCNGRGPRSVVWVSPSETADIYVDVNNDGIPETTKCQKNVQRLSSIIIENGVDLSGAVIWAVKPGQPADSMQSVPIAAAWGQNAAYSFSGDDYALDLGTLVPPFIGVRINEIVTLSVDNDRDGMISPGDVVEYTIQVQNAGQKNYAACGYRIQNPGLPANLPRQTYVAGTCVFINNGAQQSCADSALNGGDGLCSPAVLPNRGGVHYYKFKALIGPPSVITQVDISDQGNLTQTGLGPILPFSAATQIYFRPSINIEKTVFKGTLATCSNGAELQEGRQGDIVTYCYEVKNTGNSYLSNVVVKDPNIAMPDSAPLSLMPGEVKFVKFQTTIPASATTTNATVMGTPVLVNGNPIPTYTGGPVTDIDSAGVKPLPYTSGLTIKKYAGPPNSACNTAGMQDDSFNATTLKFEYCYIITSTGDECVTGVVLSDNSVGGIGSQTITKICPTDAPLKVSGPVTFSASAVPSTNATVTGSGEFSKLQRSATDPAAVVVPGYTPSVSIKKYAGAVGSNCNYLSMSDDLYTATNQQFEYCYIITNTGNECIVNGSLTDTAVGGKTTTIDKLCPKASITITGPTTTTAASIPSTAAKVSGNGEFSTKLVSCNDPAGVTIPNYTPSLTIKKYAGPVGSNCNIPSMQDDIYASTNLNFEYCYIIQMSGNECALNLAVTDPAKGGVSQTYAKLCPADQPIKIVGPPSSTTTDIPPTDATVKGTGEFSKKALEVKDGAGVDVPSYNPSLTVKKYAGAVGSNCNVGTMSDDLYVATNLNFEYCYIITNTGTECVVGGSLTDTAVGGKSTTLDKICPGAKVTITGPASTSTTSIPSTPATVTGKGEFTQTPVTTTDPAGVTIPNYNPTLTIKKYAGPVGSNCNIGLMKDDVYEAKDLTFEYCYVISNTGNECVLNLSVSDAAKGGSSKTYPRLCKGDADIKIVGPPSNTTSDIPSTPASVTGSGEFSKKPATASDAAAIDIPEYQPSLSIKKYAGPPGSFCNVELMQDDTYTATDNIFEYCYLVNNTGNECVLNVVLVDSVTGGVGTQAIPKICPGDAVVPISGSPTFLDATIPSTDATLTGVGQYSGLQVNARDPAAVTFVPPVILSVGISIEKTVHLGNIPTCFDGQELEYGFSGTVVTYCYKVTNPGEVPLNVKVTDGPVGTDESFLLPPGLTTWVKKVSSITADLSSDGVAVGTPKDSERTVTDMDGAGVKLVPTKPVCE